jgi:hypothetical protein
MCLQFGRILHFECNELDSDTHSQWKIIALYDLGGHYVDFNKYSPRFFSMNENKKKTKDVCNKTGSRIIEQ